MKRERLLESAVFCVVFVLSFAREAHAQSAGEKAAAEALFREASDLMANAKLKEACAKYQASQDLDPALGTLLRLADCYDRVGKTASAWALFAEAEATANRSQQPERAQIAATRAEDLKERLSTLVLEVQKDQAPPGLVLTVDDATIPAASWGTPLPFDPGVKHVSAKAPGYREWSSDFELPKGPVKRTLRVPELVPLPPEAQAGEPSPLLSATSSPPMQEAPDAAGTQAALGYVTGGTGLVALTVAGAIAYRAYGLNQDSFAQCAKDDPNACTERGKQLRDEAARYGSWATIVGGIGGGLAVTGLVLVLTAPNSKKAHARQGVRLSAGVTPDTAGVSMSGVF